MHIPALKRRSLDTFLMCLSATVQSLGNKQEEIQVNSVICDMTTIRRMCMTGKKGPWFTEKEQGGEREGIPLDCTEYQFEEILKQPSLGFWESLGRQLAKIWGSWVWALVQSGNCSTEGPGAEPWRWCPAAVAHRRGRNGCTARDGVCQNSWKRYG